jgi:RNAse (barnase) inhibitor barstar
MVFHGSRHTIHLLSNKRDTLNKAQIKHHPFRKKIKKTKLQPDYDRNLEEVWSCLHNQSQAVSLIYIYKINTFFGTVSTKIE